VVQVEQLGLMPGDQAALGLVGAMGGEDLCGGLLNPDRAVGASMTRRGRAVGQWRLGVTVVAGDAVIAVGRNRRTADRLVCGQPRSRRWPAVCWVVLVGRLVAVSRWRLGAL